MSKTGKIVSICASRSAELSPDLRSFIDLVIVPALAEKYMAELLSNENSLEPSSEEMVYCGSNILLHSASEELIS